MEYEYWVRRNYTRHGVLLSIELDLNRISLFVQRLHNYGHTRLIDEFRIYDLVQVFATHVMGVLQNIRLHATRCAIRQKVAEGGFSRVLDGSTCSNPNCAPVVPASEIPVTVYDRLYDLMMGLHFEAGHGLDYMLRTSLGGYIAHIRKLLMEIKGIVRRQIQGLTPRELSEDMYWIAQMERWSRIHCRVTYDEHMANLAAERQRANEEHDRLIVARLEASAAMQRHRQIEGLGGYYPFYSHTPVNTRASSPVNTSASSPVECWCHHPTGASVSPSPSPPPRLASRRRKRGTASSRRTRIPKFAPDLPAGLPTLKRKPVVVAGVKHEMENDENTHLSGREEGVARLYVPEGTPF